MCLAVGLICKLSFSVLFKILIMLCAFNWRTYKSCSFLDTNVSQHCLLIFLVSLFTVSTNLFLYSILSVSEHVVKYRKYAFFLFSIKFLISSFLKRKNTFCVPSCSSCLKLHSLLVVMYCLKFAILH